MAPIKMAERCRYEDYVFLERVYIPQATQRTTKITLDITKSNLLNLMLLTSI